MNVSAGWFLLAGGVVGAIRNATAKRFFKSDFQNLDCVISEEDRHAAVPVTKIQRLLLVVICVLLAIVGVVLIQRAHNWHPLFMSGLQPSGSFLAANPGLRPGL